ncbi:MAG: universal stress protein [Bacteroidales bacterium]|nr:universal stress protein [Bacteroidales bacterium]
MKTILAMIKHPASAEKFLKYAIGVAGDMKMKLHVMYVESPAHHPVGGHELSGVVLARMQESLSVQIKQGKKQLEELVAELIPDGSGLHSYEVGAETGDETSIINKLVQEDSIHMVMLRNPEEDLWFRDSRVQAISREAKCPVWVIPEDVAYTPFRKVLYITDYNEEDIPTMNMLVDLLRVFKPDITALHVTEDLDFELRIKNAGFQKVLKDKINYSPISVKALVPQRGEDGMELVNSYAKRIQADLIVVLQENLSFLERLFRQDKAARLLEEANRPVLNLAGYK